MIVDGLVSLLTYRQSILPDKPHNRRLCYRNELALVDITIPIRVVYT